MKTDPNDIIFWSQVPEYYKEDELDHIRTEEILSHVTSLCGLKLEGEGTWSIPSDGYDEEKCCMKCVEIYQENRKK